MWPPKNERPADRQGKISHLLRIILGASNTLTKWEREFIDDMGSKLNRRRGIEPATALSEKQARKLRSIIFKHYNSYEEVLPSLPSGVTFKSEVRRLLKSQPNPNEVRNQSIRLAKGILSQFLSDLAERNEWWDGEKKVKNCRFLKAEGVEFTFNVRWELAQEGSYVEPFTVNVDTRKVKSELSR